MYIPGALIGVTSFWPDVFRLCQYTPILSDIKYPIRNARITVLYDFTQILWKSMHLPHLVFSPGFRNRDPDGTPEVPQ